jgi:hypothetical protein
MMNKFLYKKINVVCILMIGILISRNSSWFKKCPSILSASRIYPANKLCNSCCIRHGCLLKLCKLINFMKLIRKNQGQKSVLNRSVFWHNFRSFIVCYYGSLHGRIDYSAEIQWPTHVRLCSQGGIAESGKRWLANFSGDLIPFCFRI